MLVSLYKKLELHKVNEIYNLDTGKAMHKIHSGNSRESWQFKATVYLLESNSLSCNPRWVFLADGFKQIWKENL